MFDFLESGIELDASGYRDGADEAVDAALDVGGATDDASQSLIDIDKRGVAAGGALAGLGTAMQATLDDTQELRESLGRTAASTDLTSDEMTGLARSLNDATFPIEDATATLDALAQQGVESEAELERLALASDNLADATGTSAESIASDLAPAVRGLDGDLDGIEDNADTFTTAIRNTTLEADDLGRVLERSSTELQEMGVQSDEATQLIAAYADETGKSGRQASRDFSSAVRDADGDVEALKNELGLTEDQIRQYSGELDANAGATDRHAEAANESLTAMDSLRAGFDSARLALGDYLGPVSAAAPALQGLGVAAIALSTINVSAVAPSFAAVSAAAAPVTAVVLGLAAAAGILYKAWDSNFLGIQQRTASAFDALGSGVDWIRDKFRSGIGHITDVIFAIPGALGDVISKIPGGDRVLEKFDMGTDALGDNLFPPKPGEEGEEVGEEVAEGVARGAGSGAAADVDPAAEARARQGDPSGIGPADAPGETPPASTSQPETAPAASGTTGSRSSEMELSRETIRDLSDALAERVEGTALEVLLDIDDREFDRLVKDRVDAEITN